MPFKLLEASAVVRDKWDTSGVIILFYKAFNINDFHVNLEQAQNWGGVKADKVQINWLLVA
jgi:hypothetical protein